MVVRNVGGGQDMTGMIMAILEMRRQERKDNQNQAKLDLQIEQLRRQTSLQEQQQKDARAAGFFKMLEGDDDNLKAYAREQLSQMGITLPEAKAVEPDSSGKSVREGRGLIGAIPGAIGAAGQAVGETILGKENIDAMAKGLAGETALEEDIVTKDLDRQKIQYLTEAMRESNDPDKVLGIFKKLNKGKKSLIKHANTIAEMVAAEQILSDAKKRNLRLRSEIDAIDQRAIDNPITPTNYGGDELLREIDELIAGPQ